jgi:hypothetical protein
MASLAPSVDESGFFQVRNELPDLAGHFGSIAMILHKSSQRLRQDVEDRRSKSDGTGNCRQCQMFSRS